ncbi:MAG TPA: flagellar FlbD family protein [Bryobacteraceae bacterium]|nr:flagellar FlbD family protein [Bryobacteraceae bacterium]
MIRITKLDGESIALNSDLIVHIEETPDTVITLVTGQAYRVRESLDEICRRVVAFRRSLGPVPVKLPAGIRDRVPTEDYGYGK